MQGAEPQHPGLHRQPKKAEKPMPMTGRSRGDCRKAIVLEEENPTPNQLAVRDLP